MKIRFATFANTTVGTHSLMKERQGRGSSANRIRKVKE